MVKLVNFMLCILNHKKIKEEKGKRAKLLKFPFPTDILITCYVQNVSILFQSKIMFQGKDAVSLIYNWK